MLVLSHKLLGFTLEFLVLLIALPSMLLESDLKAPINKHLGN